MKFLTAPYLVVELAVVDVIISIDQLECVAAVPIHVAVSIRNSSVGEEDENLVGAFGAQWKKVPEHVRIFAMSARVPLLRVNETGEQERVTNKKNRCVIAHNIPITLLSVELHSETTRVTDSISRTWLATDGGKTNSDGGSFADRSEDGSLRILRNIVSYLEIAEGTSSLGVHHTFGDPLPI